MAKSSDDKQYDYLFKLLLIGDSAVGKTSLLLQFADNQFNHTFIATIGIDFKVRTIELGGKRIKLQIWDTAGQERFRTITTAYYRGAMGIMLVYDITNRRSFSNITTWMNNISQHANPKVSKMLLGNKCDFDHFREVKKDDGEALANAYGIPFMETSAKTNINVQDAFMTLTRNIKTRIEQEVDHNNLPREDTRNINSKRIKRPLWRCSIL
ncbi:unnamed protein product [Schistosoma turkestanicum]|nr:unnamed protein product [Schistosoma turkestanicum]